MILIETNADFDADVFHAISSEQEGGRTRAAQNLLNDIRMHDLRARLVDLALSWEEAFGNAPHITAALSEFDAARLVGCSIEKYSACMRAATAVQRGYDFQFDGRRYQIKANRPSGKPGSFVTLVPKAKNFDWDVLIWILYNKNYEIEEAWQWEAAAYQEAFESVKRLSPAHYRGGTRLR